MLRRVATANGAASASGGAWHRGGGSMRLHELRGAVLFGACAASLVLPRRTMTTRGQFNPIHDFAPALALQQRARNAKEFEALITNPGPLRVGYSPDYLDWLYKAYQAKLRYVDARAKAERLLQQTPALLTGRPRAHSSGTNREGHNRGAAALGNSAGEEGEDADVIETLPGAPPPGKFLRPAHSLRRLAGEAARAAAQRVLDDTARRQGLLDLFERQPQFPVIHIDRASRFHIVELFKQLVLDKALAPREIWDRALLYRAILSERRASYPASFRYIHACVEDTVLVPPPSAEPLRNDEAKSSKAKLSEEAQQLAQRCPTVRDYQYFLYLVRRYYIDNAIEGHIVLRCHRDPDAAELLFSQPPPRDELEVRRSIFQPQQPSGTTGKRRANESSSNSSSLMPVLRPPTRYPEIECLWRCAENLPLLTLLVFGELNLVVSENPFVKFPRAQARLTRPYVNESALHRDAQGGNASGSNTTSSNRGRGQRQNMGNGGIGGGGRQDSEGVSLANLITERRGHLLAPLPRGVAAALDARGQDLQRLQQRHHREDVVGFQALLRTGTAEVDGSLYHSYADYAYLNPHVVRAEARDELSRRTMAALKRYDAAAEDLYRESYDVCESAQARRPAEVGNTIATYIPTLPHFIARISHDPHISFLLHTARPSSYYTTNTSSSPPQPDMHEELRRYIFQLGRALHQTALEYHKELVRRVNRQKVNIAAALLDHFVQECWQRLLMDSSSSSSTSANAASDEAAAAGQSVEDEVGVMAARLGPYRPFETRVLDESGFPTDARVEDYRRWMAPPQGAAT